MGFLERSRSLRRKDSAVPLKKVEATPTTQPIECPRAARERSATITAQNTRGSSIAGKPSSQNGPKYARPNTAGRVSERDQGRPPPMPGVTPDYHTFKFPSASASPRTSISHGRNLTLHGNGSSAAMSLSSENKAPEYKRSFTSPVPQASIEKGGVIKMSTNDLPKLDSTAASSQKRPGLHKSKSSTWRSFFQRKSSKPPVPNFDPSEAAALPALPKKEFGTASPVSAFTTSSASPITGPSKTDFPSRSPITISGKQDAFPAPSQIDINERKEPRGMARQNIRAELERTHYERSLAASKIPSGSSAAPARPHMSRSSTQVSIASSAVSETYFDARSQPESQGGLTPNTPGQKPQTPRLEVSIPTVEMERYSVMFEKLLKPKQTILERRRTAIQGLNLPGEITQPERLTPTLDTPGVPKRRATSPNIIAPTPMTAEFQDSTSQIATPIAMQRASGIIIPRVQLRRSHTAPPGGLSPGDLHSGQQQQRRQQQQQQAAATNLSSACSPSNSPMWSEASDLPATPDTTTETSTYVSLGGEETDDDEDVDIVTYDQKPLKPVLNEPSWEMLTKSTTACSTADGPPPIPPKAPGRANSREPSRERLDEVRQERFPPRSSSLNSMETSSLETPSAQGETKRPTTQAPLSAQGPPAFREAHPNPLQMNAPQPLQQRAVQMGVARKVSVRRPAGSHPGPSSRSAQATVAQPVSMYSKQPLRPQLVEVRNRKSTMIVLDSSSSASVSKESLPLQ